MNYADLQRRVDYGEIILAEAYRIGSAHKAYGWVPNIPGLWDEAQRNAYHLGYKGMFMLGTRVSTPYGNATVSSFEFTTGKEITVAQSFQKHDSFRYGVDLDDPAQFVFSPFKLYFLQDQVQEISE